jgi:hypothetical protein
MLNETVLIVGAVFNRDCLVIADTEDCGFKPIPTINDGWQARIDFQIVPCNSVKIRGEKNNRNGQDSRT